MNKGGRPSSYEPWMARVAAKLYELGATNADVADAFDRADSTIDKWLAEIPDFAATKKGKEYADADVERSLLQRAKGYTTDDGVHVPGHPTAMIFWLKNRQRKKWQDKHEIQHSGSIATTTDPQAIAEQLVSMANANPTLTPVIHAWATNLIARLPEIST